MQAQFFSQGIHNPGKSGFTEYVNIEGTFDTMESAVEAARKVGNFEIVNIFDEYCLTAIWSVSDNKIKSAWR